MNKRLKIACIAAAVIAVIAVVCYFAPVRSIEVRDLSKEKFYVGESRAFISVHCLYVKLRWQSKLAIQLQMHHPARSKGAYP